jgi:hypothetical protein
MGGDTVHMTIDGSTGNVGVGTTAPGKELEVAGTLRLSDGLSNAVDMNVVSSTGLWNETQKLIGPNPGASTYFGRDVSMSEDGTYLVVGAYGNDDVTTNAGIAYVYVKSGTSWVLQDALKASDGDVNDYFGYAVAMSSDGTHVLVGAYADEQTNASNGGSAYIFSRSGSTWSQQAKLTASSYAASDYMGYRVSISGDGSIALVSAHGAESAYVYLKPSGSAWTDATEDAVLTASDGADGDNFGYDVAISSDGTTAVVGALDNGSGSVYVFVTSDGGSTWTQQQQITGTSAGASAVGADFGSGVTVSSDGTYIAIGARYDGDNGEDFGYGSMYVYVTTNGGTSWTKQQKLVPSDAAQSIKRDARFADKHTLSISSDGSRIIATAERSGLNDGTAYAFQRTGTTWEETQAFYPRDSTLRSDDGEYFGSAVCVSPDGTHAVIGAWFDSERGTGAGAAYVFKYDDVKKLAVSGGLRLTDGQSNVVDMSVQRVVSSWKYSEPIVQQVSAESDDGATDFFGLDVKMSKDGNTAVIAASGHDDDRGAVYVFERSRKDRTGSWSKVARLLPNDRAVNDFFGRFCAVSGDGSVIVVGAYGNDDNGSASGCAYVYVRPPAGWGDTSTQTAKLRASDAAANHEFGINVGISNDGNTILAGAAGTSIVGRVYVYVKPSGGWADSTQQNAKLTAYSGSTGNQFGFKTSISGDGNTILAGARGVDTAYVFVKPSGGWTDATEDARLTSPSSVIAGYATALSYDGSVAVVGDHEYNTYQGCVNVYVKPSTGWSTTSTPTARLTCSSTVNTEEQLGYAVSISSDGNTIAASAYQDETRNFSLEHTNVGSVMIFQKGDQWVDATETARFFPPVEQVYQMSFGIDASLSGDGRSFVVGAYQANDAITSEQVGKAYFYDLPNDHTDLKLAKETALSAPRYYGGLTTFLTGDNTSVTIVSHSTSYIRYPLISYTFPVPEEYHDLGMANLEIYAQARWMGEIEDPWNYMFNLRIYYGTEETSTSYVESKGNTYDGSSARHNGIGIPVVSYHNNFDSTLESATISTRFYIPNCPLSKGNILRLAIIGSAHTTSTVYTNRTVRTTSADYETGTTSFFMALKVV